MVVENYTRRADNGKINNVIKKRSEESNISKIADSKISSTLDCSKTENIGTRRETRTNKEGLHFSENDKFSKIFYSSDAIKDANFEYEEEWDIGGIPELLNELDADIEKSLKNNQTSKFDGVKNSINANQDIFKTLQSKHYEKEKLSNNLNFSNNALIKVPKNKISLKNISASTFTGFSKGGHLISNSTLSIPLCSTTLNENIGQQFKQTKKLEQGCTISMSSHTGNNGNTGSGGGTNVICAQIISGSNNSNKPNSKMSIDHQATLDKGLKMKIKRTKPGTKSSEAKHEIVKATEQQQNGLIGGGTTVCATSQEDIPFLLSNQLTSPNSQNSNVALGINNAQCNSAGNKKVLGSGHNQNNAPSPSGNISLNNTGPTSNSVSQTISQGAKRGNSGHRRDKAKEKSSHSNRTGIEKNNLVTFEKESIERPLCPCSTTDDNVSSCSNSSCIRKTEYNTHTHRLPAKSAPGNISVVPPGVFTPSADASTSAAVSSLLAVSTTISPPVCTQTVLSGGNAYTPGPSSKEVSASNVGNIKISSHIAAQLAAAAASNSSTNGSCVTTNNELKPNSSHDQSNIVKQSSTNLISAAVHPTLSLPIPTPKTASVSSTITTENSITITTLSNDHSESPPSKRVKLTDNNPLQSSINKDMVDICIGTSIGTITEPDCLGPCEPGTSVTLEGIVWHETEGGVLVVNVTWRGKTYVGTLLDCTRHDWAPPRFCDSPTEDMDVRTPKGRAKRNRTTITPDLSNFTETRSSIYFSHSHVHSKLRNGSTKGGRGTSRTSQADKINSGSSLSSGNGGSTPSTSPTAFLPPRAEKRKSKDESPPPVCADNEAVNSGMINASGLSIPSSAVGSSTNQSQSLINPVTGLNVQISTKKCKISSPCAISPVLLECPENDCSKKYKHLKGLHYHQSHAHGSTSLIDEDYLAEAEDHITPQHSPLSSTLTPSLTPNPSDLIPNNQISISSQSEAAQTSVECKTTNLNEEQQFESPGSNFTSEIATSLSCEDIVTSTVSSSTTASVPCYSENISGGAIEHEQQKKFLDLVENNNINMNVVLSLGSNNQAPVLSGKSGVLRFVQEESKVDNNNSSLLITNSDNDILIQSESLENASPKNCISGRQDSNSDTFHTESLENATNLNQSQHSIGTHKTSHMSSVVVKPKKERKSPSVNEYEAVKLNTCNTSSRDDVQSPAYSDISDDSTPVNEADHTDQVGLSKNCEINKKPQDIGLLDSTTCPSTPTNISSALSSYGAYQFYQQQQFIVPPVAEQPQPAKNSLSASMGSTTVSPSLNQQQTLSEFNSKKDPALDLISKANLNQTHSSQDCEEINKDSARTICATGSQGNIELSVVTSVGSGALNSTTAKSGSHFYGFNYMPSNYTFNVNHNFGSACSITSEHNTKTSRISSPNDQSQQQHIPALHKEDRSKDEIISIDNVKSSNPQASSKQPIKSDSVPKSESIKQESTCSPLSQIPQHMQIPGKDNQAIGVYTNMYQRHPLALAPQQLSREEELRRYYIFSDHQRRHNSSSLNAISPQLQNISHQSGNQQCKDDVGSSQQHAVHNQQQIKLKGHIPPNISKSTNSAHSSKESKHKQEEELKVTKQEGQKPTMETHGPPPPPTSQYFLHPPYITSTPFGFDPSHPMYRNVLMPATSPYNAPPYHLPIPRYHAPEDLSRNSGTKALDALHHAASQYYTTHKIHELSERALKSPNNSNSSNVAGTIKVSGSSPNIVTTQHSNIGSNIIGHHALQNQSSSVTQLPHNLASQTIGVANKQDLTSQKIHGNGSGAAGTSSETQKAQTVNSSLTSSCNSVNSGNDNSNNGNNVSVGSASDLRSPPPQRHVHTHHHTHVGLGYPMYPAPYGAAVLASQQAAAVAVINPFPPGPSK